ncbi:MAG: hypothetical protein ACXVCY_18185 [Pseudobdellovibrionaceae bacterium]
MRKLIYIFCLLGFLQISAADVPPLGKWCHLRGNGNSTFQKDVHWSLDYSLIPGGAAGRGGYTYAAQGWLNINGNFSGLEEIWIEWSPSPLSIERRSMKLNYDSESNKFTGNLGRFDIRTIPTGSGFSSFEGGLDLTININGQRLSLGGPFAGAYNEIPMNSVGICDP